MPTTRRRRTRKPAHLEVSRAVFILLTWDDWSAAAAQQERDKSNALELFGGWQKYPDSWAVIEDRAVAAWVEAYPGTRPTSWWRWSAPELRRLTGGTYTLIKGMGRCHETGLPYIDHGWRHDPPLAETQPGCLDRLDLWLPGERERVPTQAFESQLFSYESTMGAGMPGSERA